MRFEKRNVLPSCISVMKENLEEHVDLDSPIDEIKIGGAIARLYKSIENEDKSVLIVDANGEDVLLIM